VEVNPKGGFMTQICNLSLKKLCFFMTQIFDLSLKKLCFFMTQIYDLSLKNSKGEFL